MTARLDVAEMTTKWYPNTFDEALARSEVIRALARSIGDVIQDLDNRGKLPSSLQMHLSNTNNAAEKVEMLFSYLDTHHLDAELGHAFQQAVSARGGIPLMLNSQLRDSHAQNQQPVNVQVLSEYEIYGKHLLGWGRGLPLLDAAPQGNLPIEYKKMGICFGDVGAVTPEGGWDFFFNIYCSANHPINCNGVPDGFYCLDPVKDADIYIGTFPPGSHVTSSDIELHFTCWGPYGALLALPDGSQHWRLQNVEAMRKYAAQNAESWYRHVNEQRGRHLVNGSLRLITGCEKSSFGGMATFQNIPVGKDFGISFAPVNNHNGDTIYCFSGQHPAHTRTFASLEDKNNSVFIRGFTISLGQGILVRLGIKGSSVSLQSGDTVFQNSSDGYIPFGSGDSFLSSFFGFLTGSSSTTGSRQITALDTRYVQVSELAPIANIFDPSQLINNKIVQMPEASNATVIITHDDDW
ncbi:hypothetical protein C8F01DRAFT_1234006, partial [Mycena amicta]